jgi:hypothetical protein
MSPDHHELLTSPRSLRTRPTPLRPNSPSSARLFKTFMLDRSMIHSQPVKATIPMRYRQFQVLRHPLLNLVLLHRPARRPVLLVPIVPVRKSGPSIPSPTTTMMLPKMPILSEVRILRFCKHSLSYFMSSHHHYSPKTACYGVIRAVDD